MPVRQLLLAVAVAAGALTLLPSAPALASCGGAEKADAGRKLGDFAPPLMIGDSVLLGAIGEVAAAGYEINTRGCRGWAEGANIVRRRKRSGTLPHMVGMFLGADFSVSEAQIRNVMYVLGPKRVLLLVTPREVGGVGGEDAQNMRRMAKRYPTRIYLLDWVRHTRHRSAWFGPDGLHLSNAGIAGLGRFVKRPLQYAAPGAFPPAA
jgi:hypothetical protein